ncbi:uncharacterized protein A4U43_C07F20180 [Asparagus officinalis]|uniref:Uncharacterized protein n=1 Tax=Asparagus officinalis TaxID=4686 RepID=A0A5P1EIK8_ASPOF|nr:uncharacterized protein A4U43_C07F20180 [Asparagus officinalis]
MASSKALQAYGHGIQRQDLKVALAKAMELRALHAALVQGSNSSPTALPRIQPGASPSLSISSHQLSVEDYAVFTLVGAQPQSAPECGPYSAALRDLLGQVPYLPGTL